MTESTATGGRSIELSLDGSVLTVSVSLSFRRRSGRKRVETPAGEVDWAPQVKIDNALVKALARAFRWRRILEAGTYGTVVELGTAERINEAYVRRLLRLTFLAPDIVEAILDGRQPSSLQLEQLRDALPVEWEEQRKCFGQRRFERSASPQERPFSVNACRP